MGPYIPPWSSCVVPIDFSKIPQGDQGQCEPLEKLLTGQARPSGLESAIKNGNRDISKDREEAASAGFSTLRCD